MNLEAMQRATEVAEAIYKTFLDKVVKVGVLNDRCDSRTKDGYELSEKQIRKITEGVELDPRVIRLMSISGKGGWDEDAEKRGRYLKNFNVTLLDHLLSVTRGSLLMAAIDWLIQNPEMEETRLRQRLTVMAVVAFMHDIDKDLGLIRNTDIELKAVTERMQRYGIAEFLETAKVTLEADQLLYLVQKVESQQANRTLPTVMPPQYADGVLPLYVRLADKLDGIWLANDPQEYPKKQGITGVLERVANDHSCIQSDFLRHWQVVDIFDPHHPFLLDELQKWLSRGSRVLAHCPPFIEIHHDGRLVVLLPKEKAKEIIESAIQSLCQGLPFPLDVFIPPRGEPSIVNAKPSYAELKQFVSNDLSGEKLKKLFLIKASYKSLIIEHFSELPVTPVFPENYGQSMTLYASFNQDDGIVLKQAALAILLLNLNIQPKPKEVPDQAAREEAFLAVLSEPRPTWITELSDGNSRRVVTALWAVTIANPESNEEVYEAIWGTGGLLQSWLEGSEEKGQKGFKEFIKAEGGNVAKEVETHFRQLLTGQRIVVEDEDKKQGRCLFTDQPVAFDDIIKDNLELGKVGINVSAFTGRAGRLESLDLTRGHTHISPVSKAEYTLRTRVLGTKTLNEMPTLISSPSTLGLFGGLLLNTDAAMNMQTLSLSDLTKLEASPTHLRGVEQYTGRYRIARLEYLSGKTETQVNQLYWLLKATLRVGRPMHIFHGLPTTQRAFFYYDAMPQMLSDLLGGKELRLEQIPDAIHRLETAKLLLETWGCGYTALQLYANPTTRFRGVCFAWCGLHEKNQRIAVRLESEYQNLIGGQQMTEEDGVMVKLGRAAAMIQHYPKKGFGASHSEQFMVLDVCREVLDEAFKMPKPQLVRLSLIHGIAERLEITLRRRNLRAARKHRDGISFPEACVKVATLFIDDFWIGVMNKRFPSQGNLRFAKSVYRMSFMLRDKPVTEEDTADDNHEVETTASV